jgi:hypothetical protein
MGLVLNNYSALACKIPPLIESNSENIFRDNYKKADKKNYTDFFPLGNYRGGIMIFL